MLSIVFKVNTDQPNPNWTTNDRFCLIIKDNILPLKN